MGQILGAILAALFGKFLEWMKQSELDHQVAVAEELKQHAASVQAASTAQLAAIEAAHAHQEAALQVTELQAQLDAIKKWNDKSRELKIRARNIKRPV